MRTAIHEPGTKRTQVVLLYSAGSRTNMLIERVDVIAQRLEILSSTLVVIHQLSFQQCACLVQDTVGWFSVRLLIHGRIVLIQEGRADRPRSCGADA